METQPTVGGPEGFRKAAASRAAVEPGLSVVVPTRDRPKQLERCLQALACLEDPDAGFEVVVVNDGGSPRVEDVVDRFRDRLDLTLVSQVHNGPGGARNTGAARAVGKFLVFTADDCVPECDWLREIEACFSDYPDSMLGGAIANGLPEQACATATHLLVEYLYACWNSDPEHARFFTPNNMAVPAAHFDRIGGFDVAMGSTGEDREFCDRWLHQGFSIRYVPSAIVHHVHPQTVVGLWCQHFAYGRGSRRYYRRRHSSRVEAWKRGRLLPSSFAFYRRLLVSPLETNRGLRAALLVFLMGYCQLANAAGFLIESVRSRAEKPGGTGP